MDDAWLGLAVVALLAIAVAVAVVYDLRGGGRGKPDVSDAALRRARQLDARNQPPGPPAGTRLP